MFHIALCDDDKRFLQRFSVFLRDKFSRYNYDIKTDLFYDGRHLIEQVEKRKRMYDMIFLDIKMPTISGFLTAEKLRALDSSFCLLFITQLTVVPKQAFRYNVFRYIDKDSLEDDIDEAIAAYLKKRKMLSSKDEFIEFSYNYMNEIRSLAVKKKNILYLEVINRRVWLFTKYGEYEMHTYSLQKYWEKLGSQHFIIISRKYCVNLAQIVELTGDYFRMSNNKTICIGTTEKAKEEAVLRYGKYRAGRLWAL